jgi:general secretion pathway protein G
MFKSKSGFTIVELLIVIVVIGILAAIVIVAYTGIQNKAYDASVQSDLATIVKKIQVEMPSSGIYAIPSTSTGIKINKSAYYTASNNLYFCKNDATGQFALAARSRSGKTYKYTSGSGVTESATLIYGADTCALVGVGSWSLAYAIYGYDLASTSWYSWAQ